MCEADVCGDHARPLTWEPDASQRRSIGVRLPQQPSSAAAAEEESEGQSAAERAAPKRQALAPRGSIGVQFAEGVVESK